MTKKTETGPVIDMIPAPLVRPEKKIAIFGTTPSRMEGPWQDDSGWQRWTIGPGGCETHGWERLYEIHSWWPEDFKGYLGFLSTVPREVWTMRPMSELMAQWKYQHKKTDEVYRSEIPGDFSSNKVIPKDLLNEKYGRTWMMSSISYLMAQAIEEGATDIGLWGIDLEAGEEYTAQFLGARYFIDLASKFLGINVHLPPGCGLMREPNAYPDRYETFFAMNTQRKADWLRSTLSGMDAQYSELQAQVHRVEGRLWAWREVKAPEEEIQKGEQELIAANNQLGQLAANINTLKGELNATDYYRRMHVFQPIDPDTPFYT